MFYNKTCAIYNTMRSRFIYNAHARPAMRAVHWSGLLHTFSGGCSGLGGMARTLLEVIQIDLRSPSRNSYMGWKAWSTNLWRQLRFRVPSLRFLHLLPQPATMAQLLNAMRTNPVGWPKAHVQVYPNRVHTPPDCNMVCLQDLVAGVAPITNERFIPRTSSTPLFTVPLLCNGTGGPHVPPPSFQVRTPLH